MDSTLCSPMRSLKARIKNASLVPQHLRVGGGEVEHRMAAGGADTDLKYMEPLQVFEYMPDEEQVEPLSDMIA